MSEEVLERADGALTHCESTYKDILWVLILDGSDDSGSNHGLLPRFGQVEVEDAIPSAIVYVRFHLRVAVLSSDVHLATNEQVRKPCHSCTISAAL